MTLGDLVTQIVATATGIVDGATLALFIAAGAVISAAGILVRRFIRAGR